MIGNLMKFDNYDLWGASELYYYSEGLKTKVNLCPNLLILNQHKILRQYFSKNMEFWAAEPLETLMMKINENNGSFSCFLLKINIKNFHVFCLNSK